MLRHTRTRKCHNLILTRILGDPALPHIDDASLAFFVTSITNLVACLVSMIIKFTIAWMIMFSISWIWYYQNMVVLNVLRGDKLSVKEQKDWEDHWRSTCTVAFLVAFSYGCAALIAVTMNPNCPTSIAVYFRMEYDCILVMLAVFITTVLFRIPIWCYICYGVVRTRFSKSKESQAIPLADAIYN